MGTAVSIALNKKAAHLIMCRLPSYLIEMVFGILFNDTKPAISNPVPKKIRITPATSEVTSIQPLPTGVLRQNFCILQSYGMVVPLLAKFRNLSTVLGSFKPTVN